MAFGPSTLLTHFSTSHRPKILLLHLKRFIAVENPIYAEDNRGAENQQPNSPANPISSNYVFKKDNVRVKMPLTLTLDTFLDSHENDKKDDYSLRSIVYHRGLQASSGHYFADALRPHVVDDEIDAAVGSDATSTNKVAQDVWYRFDDSNSECLASGEFMVRDPRRQKEAYMLLYTLNGDSAI
jgi:ubiquitin C-terminal hydrolase